MVAIETTVERPGVVSKFAAITHWSPCGARSKRLTFLALCILALGTLIVLYQVPYRYTVRIGDASDKGYVRGFYDSEGKGGFNYRWTADHAIIRLPQGVFPGEADVVLSGNRPGFKPPSVAASLEGYGSTALTTVQSTTDFASFPVRLPANGGTLNPSDVPGLILTPSDTQTPPKENRALGVAVDQVVIFTNPLRFGPIVPPLLAVLLVLGMAMALALMTLSVAPPLASLLSMAYMPVLFACGYLTLSRATDPGEQAHAVLGFTVAALVASVVIWGGKLRDCAWVRRLAKVDGRWLLGVAVLISLAYALYASHRMFNRLYDDTHITLRYAQNFADGYGLRFNPGEKPVEGYTNFLLTVVLAGLYKIGLPLTVMAKIISIAAGAGVVIATYWLSGIVMPKSNGLLRAMPCLVLAICGWFAYYASIGLETHLFALLITLAACLTLTRRWSWASVAFAAAYLTRPEGAGLWAVTLGWLIWETIAPHIFARIGRGRSREMSFVVPKPREIGWFALPFVVIAGVHELWRLSFYGEPLPNTFYDKVGTTEQQVRRGLEYLAHSIPELHPFVLIALIALIVVIPSATIANVAARYLALLVAAFSAYIILVGGDFIGPRFWFHIFPLIIVLAVAGIRSLFRPLGFARRPEGDHAGLRDWSRSSPLAAFCVALIVFWLFVPLFPPNTFIKQRVASTHMRVVTGLIALGEYLRDTAPPGSTLAIDAAGVVPFISRLSTLDMLGLSDYHIAHTVVATGDGLPGHEKTDPAYIVAQRPTYIAVGMSKVTSGGRPGRGLDIPGFDALYTRVALVQMTESIVSPNLVLVLTPDTDIQAAIDNGYTYALYKLK